MEVLKGIFDVTIKISDRGTEDISEISTEPHSKDVSRNCGHPSFLGEYCRLMSNGLCLEKTMQFKCLDEKYSLTKYACICYISMLCIYVSNVAQHGKREGCIIACWKKVK